MPSEARAIGDRVKAEAGSLTIQFRVLRALFIREMMTRYGRNNIGFLWLFVEPMLFVLAVIAIRAGIRGMVIGNVPIVAFAISGYGTVMMWRNMPSRCIGAVKSNRALLYHRQVTIPDVYYARMTLEMAGAMVSFIALMLIAIAYGAAPWPEDVLKMLGGWMMLAWFGFGLAMTLGALSERSSVVGKLWTPFSFLIFPLSGIAFLVETLPPGLQKIVLYIPVIHSLEYLRDGWFGNFFNAYYDLAYAIYWNLGLTFIGLALVRQTHFDTSTE